MFHIAQHTNAVLTHDETDIRCGETAKRKLCYQFRCLTHGYCSVEQQCHEKNRKVLLCSPAKHRAQHSVFFFLSGVDYRSPPHVEHSLHSSRPSHVRCSFPYSLSPMHIHSAALDGL